MKLSLVFLIIFVTFVNAEYFDIEQVVTQSKNCTSQSRTTAIVLSVILPYFGVDR